MSYQSIHFLLFAAVALLLYYIVGQKLQKYVLLLANLYFFFTSGPEHIPYILLSAAVSFLIGSRIGKIYNQTDADAAVCEDKKEKQELRAQGKAKAKKALILGMVLVLGLLVAFKIANLVIGNHNQTRDAAEQIRTFMPLGISYYTFMAVSYMLDVYWRKVKAESSFVSYAVFLSYFPHIVQGPIDRFKAVGPQINQGVKLSYQNITFGAQLTMWGFFKKMVIADRLNQFVTTVFGEYESYPGSILLVAAIFSAFELYCNFSGCMDMVRGVSQMFGIEIAKNFEQPFFSKTAGEFWHRWHITLGTWFKDYIYMPISISPKLIKIMQLVKPRLGNRAAKSVAVIIPTAIVWLLTGIWHGTGWNYVLWGIYWGAIMILSSVFQPEIAKLTEKLKINTKAGSWKLFQILRTFSLFAVSRIISSCDTVADSFRYFGRIFSSFEISALFDRSIYSIGWDRSNCQLALVLILFLLAMDKLQEKGSVRERVAGYNIVFRWILYYALLFAILIFGMYGPGYVASDFVYGNY